MNPNPKTMVFAAEEEEDESTGGAPAPARSAVVPVALEGKLPTVLVDVVLVLPGEPGNNGRDVAGESAGDNAGMRGREEEGSGVEEEEEDGESTGTGLRGNRGCMGKTEEGEGAFRDGTEFESGAVGSAFAVGTTFTSSFIPWLQCPGLPQMKYLNKIDQEFLYIAKTYANMVLICM